MLSPAVMADPTPDPALQRGRNRRVALVGVALALLYGLPSLAWPFGRDQALYDYVARGWVDGWIPYVDSFDHKPPGFYAVYALADLLFGRTQWGIRVLELAAVVGTGALAAVALGVRSSGELRVNPGVGALVASGFFYTTFDYWHTAQAEMWECLLLAGSWALVARRDPARGAAGTALAAGSLAGLAFMVKFPAGLVAVPLGLAWGWRRARVGRGPSAVAWGALQVLLYGLGAAIPMVTLSLPFVATGAFAEMWTLTVDFNLVNASRRLIPVLVPPNFLAVHAPTYGVAAAVACIWWMRRGCRRRLAAVGVVLLVACATVVWQRRMYLYHYSILTLPLTALLAGSISLRRSARGSLALAAGLVALACAQQPQWFQAPGWSYARQAASSLGRLTGATSRSAWLRPFVSRRGVRYRYADHEALAAALGPLRRDGDTLCARGYEPTLYHLVDLRCTTRFSTTFALTDSAMRYHRRAWKREYDETLERHPPTWVVTGKALEEDIQALEADGYTLVQRAGRLLLFGNAEVAARTPTPEDGARGR